MIKYFPGFGEAGLHVWIPAFQTVREYKTGIVIATPAKAGGSNLIDNTDIRDCFVTSFLAMTELSFLAKTLFSDTLLRGNDNLDSCLRRNDMEGTFATDIK